MPKTTPDKLSILRSRIRASKEIMEHEKKSVWTKCRNFYEGKHFGPDDCANPHKMHTINLVWSTVRTLLSTQYYKNPHFTLEPRKPEFGGTMQSLHESVMDYWVERALLKPIARSCVQGTFTDLAIITWGCDTKFNKGSTEQDSFYFKRIAPERFFPDNSSREQLFEKLPGFGVVELMRNKEVKERFGVDVEPTDSVYDLDGERGRTPYGEFSQELSDDMMRVKVYKYYDREALKLYIFAKGHDEFLDESDLDLQSIPYAVLKYNERSEGFYPTPEVFHLIDPQRMIEISASMAVEHMKRSARKIWVQEETMDNLEKEKLQDPSAGVVINVKKPGAIGSIDMGSADSSIYNVGGMFGAYFDQISTINASRRGGSSQKLTATAESIIDKYGMNRSNDTISLLSDWMKKVGKGFLDCLQKNLTLPDVIQLTNEQGGLEWVSYVPTLDLTGDYECKVQVGETAPKDDQLERAQWIDCLLVLQQNPMIIQSALLIEETLSRFQISNPRLVQELVGIGQSMMQQQQQQQMMDMMGTASKQGANAGNSLKL